MYTAPKRRDIEGHTIKLVKLTSLSSCCLTSKAFNMIPKRMMQPHMPTTYPTCYHMQGIYVSISWEIYVKLTFNIVSVRKLLTYNLQLTNHIKRKVAAWCMMPIVRIILIINPKIDPTN